MTTTGSDPTYSSSSCDEDDDVERCLSPPPRLLPVHNVNHPSPGKRLLLVFVACAQNILAGGLIIGWAGISDSILVAPISDGGAGLDLDATASIFATASAVSFVSPLLLGYVLDRFGPRCCSVLCHAFVCMGCLAFSRSGVEDGDAAAFITSRRWVWWGANLVAFAGPGFQSSAVHLSNLFPERRYLVMSSVTGTITISFGVFSLFNGLWDSFGIGLSTLFRWYGVMMVASTIAAAALFPDVPFEQQQQQQTSVVATKWMAETEGFGGGGDDGYADERLDVELVGAEETERGKDDGRSMCGDSELVRLSPSVSKPKLYGAAAADSADNVQRNTSKLTTECPVSFQEQLRSGPFVRMTILFVVTSFWANFYVGSFTVELEDHHRIFTPSQLQDLIVSFNFLSSVGFLSSPLVGYLLDGIGFVRTALITLTLGVLQQVLLLLTSFPHCTLVPARTEMLLLLSFACYSLFRSFLYPYFFACLSKKMGLRYLGILSGIAFALSGFVQFAAMGRLELWAGGTCHSSLPEQHRIEMEISKTDEEVGAGVDARWKDDGPEWLQGPVAAREANGAVAERAAPCDVGRWDALHGAQLVSLLALACVPLLDFLTER